MHRLRFRLTLGGRLMTNLALDGFCATMMCLLVTSLARPLRYSRGVDTSTELIGSPTVAGGEMFDVIEGDIIMDEYIRNLIASGRQPPVKGDSTDGTGGKYGQETPNTRSRRAAIKSGDGFDRRWSGGVVPYQYDPRLLQAPDSKRSIRAIRKAMRHWEKHTCIRFVPKKGHKDSITFTTTGTKYPCAASVGKRRGNVPVFIGRQCHMKFGKVVHELGHVVGFLHEQSRPDRDQHVNILMKNVEAGKERNFLSYGSSIDSLGVPYDYDSIMHYENNAFAKNPLLNTIEAKDNPNRKFGQRDHLSRLDIEQVNLMYNCPPPTPHPCEVQREPIKSGAKLSIKIKERKWLRCNNAECARMACKSMSDSRCDSMPKDCRHGGFIFRVHIQEQNQGGRLYHGNRVMFERVYTRNISGRNSSEQQFLQCTYDPDRHSPCALDSCAANSASGSWSTCKAAVFMIYTRNENTADSNETPDAALQEFSEDTSVPIQDNDKIALCRGSGSDRTCLSCFRLKSCEFVKCNGDLEQCPDIFFSLRQWESMQATELY